MHTIVLSTSRYGNAASGSNPTSKLGKNLLKTILSRCTNNANFQEKTGSFLDRIRYLLSQTIPAFTTSRLLCSTGAASSPSRLPFCLLGNSFFSSLLPSSYELPLLAIDQDHELNQIQQLHLITAYSGYSKSYLNQKFKTNIRTSRVEASLSGKKRGVIGDDAWFIAKQNRVDVMGVADGVGGWHEIGIDPSKFSSSLMRTCKRLVEQNFELNIDNKTPINLLEQSYSTLLESKNNRLLVGSSTACILMFHHETNFLHTCNLGDSGFCVIRNNKIIHRSQEQQHYFNSPYQIAILPNSSNFEFGEHHVNNQEEESLINDSPDAAISCSIQLDEGDFILLGTDGLWDNLADSHFLSEISKLKKNCLIDELERAANNLARKAIELALDPEYISPFAKAAKKHGIHIRGGKPDDITVLLARVTK
ncbi:phosphatase PTC7 -like protein [Brachionus plicatilis]|uniref:Protein phosphatase n=1 Tax=Brachionus plicatilis TaxID=10195 RepID=A0A3M7S9F1_BRAPC|nr:phosphatase PTC7 -like protein [Brachionus plicatilis]